ncbi:hypothetical protein F5051DRAFT_395862 [Lentinula edodes]|uniref:uncharacterized protein n=1 Tax=Lentinula edodes TaxID=5353 RepID=UPI001E8CEBA7|nr:uncharacterized protein C8R40DRAFT_513351 [Lentinula edodes]KAH7871932.1 hypothetical protein C8R40DRAFT_513351 [Lentinula edodes]KAJ3881880.1 hypothetical protein F5051DRAFT_395862 [Lentinula edodes]
MGGFSPSTYLLWSILACLFEGFLVAHLYSYDKFQCVKWGSGRQPGAFKRIMTYSYLATVPLLMVYSLTMTVLSYQQGFLITADGKVLAIPFSSWTHTARKRLLPLFFVLASAWALELVTHLEELTFWLFLLHQGPHKRDWFKSWEFRVWYLGSVIAILGMPLTVIIKRANLDLCFAWIFLAGSAAGLATTLCFMYVLVRFPGFIRRVKFEGAEPEVVVRLTIFYQLNITRMIFRFMFHFPLLILALDAVQGPHDIIAKQAASDLLVMLGGIGCFVSSAITLFIFFPRSITREIGYRVKISSTPSVDQIARAPSLPDYHREQNMSHPKPTPPAVDTFHHFENPEDLAVENLSQNPEYDGEATPQYESDPESDFIDPATVQGRNWIADTNDDATTWEMHSNEIFRTGSVTYHRPRIHQSRHGRRRDIEEQPSIGNIRAEINKYSTPPGSGKDPSAAVIVVPRISRVDPTRPLVMEEPSASHSSDVVHPYAMNFTSPIDLCDASLPRAI